jgi:hypothetical protein
MNYDLETLLTFLAIIVSAAIGMAVVAFGNLGSNV